MKINSKTTSLSTYEVRKIVNLTIKWCQSRLGVNNRRRQKFSVSIVKFGPAMGEFDFKRNTVIIYYGNNPSVKDIVKTTIHEYTHYLQSRTKYKEYEKFYYYSNHPCEREARRNEEKYTDMCIKEIKKYLL